MAAFKFKRDGLVKPRFWRSIKRALSLLLLVVLLTTGAAAWWLTQPLPLRQASVDLSVEPGQSVRTIAQSAVAAGVDVPASVLYYLFKLSGQSRQIRAGSYEINANTSAWDLLQKLVRGEENLRSITLVEGWTWQQVRQALNKSDHLKHDSASLSDEEVMSHVGLAGVAPEGRFFPDTYMVGKGTSDLKLLQRAAQAMQRQLREAWETRDMGLPLKSADEALILASIIEKETGLVTDRPMIASVFINRLRINMPLQTDPTVIYGMFERFDGNLRRVDLQTDHPWNTYTRRGLPPTPIAMPGKGALHAALHPATSQALYFVARGDGSSQFSSNLDDHNNAVNRYQRGQSAKAQ
jgi:UPF0755 protein